MTTRPHARPKSQLDSDGETPQATGHSSGFGELLDGDQYLGDGVCGVVLMDARSDNVNSVEVIGFLDPEKSVGVRGIRSC